MEVDRKRAQVLIMSELALRDRLVSLQARTREQEEDLARVEREVAEGLRIEFDIDTALLGLVIGAHGQHINSVQESTGCRVVVDDEARARAARPLCPRDAHRPDPSPLGTRRRARSGCRAWTRSWSIGRGSCSSLRCAHTARGCCFSVHSD